MAMSRWSIGRSRPWVLPATSQWACHLFERACRRHWPVVRARGRKGEGGALYHAAAGEIPNRWIAEAVARDLGCETRSVTVSEATEIWGEFGALIMSVSSRVRDVQTRKALGWSPQHLDMLSEIGEPRLRALAKPQRTKE